MPFPSPYCRLVVWALWLLLLVAAFASLTLPGALAFSKPFAPLVALVFVCAATVLHNVTQRWVHPESLLSEDPIGRRRRRSIAFARRTLAVVFGVVGVAGTALFRPRMLGETLWIAVLEGGVFAATLGYAIGDQIVPSLLRLREGIGN
jgi:hypothetical protein